MRSSNYRASNKKNEKTRRETSPFLKQLMKAVYRSGYEQGAIDLYKKKIQVIDDGDGYFLQLAEEGEGKESAE